MRIYVLVGFIICVLNFGLYGADLVSKQYPYEESISVGKTAFRVIVNAAFALWAGIVLWG
jgi:hypothetical protein